MGFFSSISSSNNSQTLASKAKDYVKEQENKKTQNQSQKASTQTISSTQTVKDDGTIIDKNIDVHNRAASTARSKKTGTNVNEGLEEVSKIFGKLIEKCNEASRYVTKATDPFKGKKGYKSIEDAEKLLNEARAETEKMSDATRKAINDYVDFVLDTRTEIDNLKSSTNDKLDALTSFKKSQYEKMLQMAEELRTLESKDYWKNNDDFKNACKVENKDVDKMVDDLIYIRKKYGFWDDGFLKMHNVAQRFIYERPSNYNDYKFNPQKKDYPDYDLYDEDIVFENDGKKYTYNYVQAVPNDYTEIELLVSNYEKAHAINLYRCMDTEFLPENLYIISYEDGNMVESGEKMRGGYKSSESSNLEIVYLYHQSSLDFGFDHTMTTLIHETIGHGVDNRKGKGDGKKENYFSTNSEVWNKLFDLYKGNLKKISYITYNEGVPDVNEFYATCVQYYYRMPDVLKEYCPGVYDELEKIYGKDSAKHFNEKYAKYDVFKNSSYYIPYGDESWKNGEVLYYYDKIRGEYVLISIGYSFAHGGLKQPDKVDYKVDYKVEDTIKNPTAGRRQGKVSPASAMEITEPDVGQHIVKQNPFDTSKYENEILLKKQAMETYDGLIPGKNYYNNDGELVISLDYLNNLYDKYKDQLREYGINDAKEMFACGLVIHQNDVNKLNQFSPELALFFDRWAKNVNQNAAFKQAAASKDITVPQTDDLTEQVKAVAYNFFNKIELGKKNYDNNGNLASSMDIWNQYFEDYKTSPQKYTFLGDEKLANTREFFIRMMIAYFITPEKLKQCSPQMYNSYLNIIHVEKAKSEVQTIDQREEIVPDETKDISERIVESAQGYYEMINNGLEVFDENGNLINELDAWNKLYEKYQSSTKYTNMQEFFIESMKLYFLKPDELKTSSLDIYREFNNLLGSDMGGNFQG